MKIINKIIKTIIISLIFLIIGFIFIEYFLYTYFISNENYSIKNDIKNYIQSHKLIKFDDLYKEKKEKNYFRDTIIQNSTSPPILIFGCSFGYGFKLRKEQAFAYKLAKITNRTVYNRSISSYDFQYMPYVLEHMDIKNELLQDFGETKQPEYIIFVLIDNHLYRQYRYFIGADQPYEDIHYKKTNNTLTYCKPKTFIFSFPIFRFIYEHYSWIAYKRKDFSETFSLMKLHFEKTKAIVDKKFPGTKIVILNYEGWKDSELQNRKIWKEFEDEGFIVIHTSKITNEFLYLDKYKIPNDVHPNEKAWDLIVPALAKELNLI